MTRQDFWKAALDTPMSEWSTFWDQAKGGVLESFGLGTAIRHLSLPPLLSDRPYRGQTKADRETQLAQYEKRALSKEAYKASAHFRNDVPWEPGMTIERAAALAQWDDARKVREFYAQKRPVTAFLGNVAGQILDPINFMPVAGPALKSIAVARLGSIGGKAAVGAFDAAANTAIAGLATAPLRASFGDDISWQATASEIATAALIGGGFGTIGGVWGSAVHARAAKRLRAIIARGQWLGTQQAERRARLIVGDVVTNLVKQGDAPVTPDDVDAIVSRAEAERASDLAAPAGASEADVSARGRDGATPAQPQSQVERSATGDAAAPEPAHPATEIEVGARIRALLDVSDEPDAKTSIVEIAPVIPKVADLVREQTGLDLSGQAHAIDGTAIGRMVSARLDESGAQSPVQLPVAPDDIVAIPEILAHATHVVTGIEGPRGEALVGFIARMPDGSLAYLEEAVTATGRLVVQSMRKYAPATEAQGILASLDFQGRSAPGEHPAMLEIAPSDGGSRAVTGLMNGETLADAASPTTTPVAINVAGSSVTHEGLADRGVWSLGVFTRGRIIEQALGHNLAPNFPTIDRIENGAVTSIKSIDLDAPTYQSILTLRRKLETYVDKVADFQDAEFNGFRISPQDITGRTLDLVIPHGGSPTQRAIIAQTVKYGASLKHKVTVNVILYPR